MSWKTPTEAAKLLNVSDRTLRRLGARGEIPRKKSTNGFSYWVDQDVRAEHRRIAPSELGSSHSDGVLEKALFLPDPHIPDNDLRATKVAFDFLEWFQPDRLFIMGDVIDFYSISRYSKDPNHPYSAQDEFDLARDFFEDIFDRIDDECEVTWLLGNHEARWKNYLWNSAPELSTMRSLDIRKLTGLEDRDVKIVPYNRGCNYRGRFVEHGKLVSGKSGYTAHRLIEKKMVCGINGHTHRLGHVHKRSNGGEYDWVEVGTLQTKDPEYAGEITNWQHGLAVSYWRPDFKVPKVETVHIDEQYICCYAGKVFCG